MAFDYAAISRAEARHTENQQKINALQAQLANLKKEETKNKSGLSDSTDIFLITTIVLTVILVLFIIILLFVWFWRRSWLVAPWLPAAAITPASNSKNNAPT